LTNLGIISLLNSTTRKRRALSLINDLGIEDRGQRPSSRRTDDDDDDDDKTAERKENLITP